MKVRVPDLIERELVLRSPRPEVWAALTTPKGLADWWCDRAEIDLRPGGAIAFDFGAEHGTYEATVVAVEPEELFAMIWRPFHGEPDADAAGDLTTRVEFRLEDHPDGTLLKLRETGFAALPGTLAQRTLSDNTTGWDIDVLPRLRRYVETGVASE